MTDAAVSVIALGDSTGVGIGATDGQGGFPDRLVARARRAGLSVRFHNGAQSGARSSDVPRQQLSAALRQKPQVAIIGIGTNDVWRLIPVEAFRENLASTLRALREAGAYPLVCNIADMALTPAALAAQVWLGLAPAQITARVRDFNRALGALATEHRFELIDVFTFSQAELGTNPAYVCGDGFHPSSRGYERWTDLCWEPFERAVASASSLAYSVG